jgi:hypothetical protein
LPQLVLNVLPFVLGGDSAVDCHSGSVHVYVYTLIRKHVSSKFVP